MKQGSLPVYKPLYWNIVFFSSEITALNWSLKKIWVLPSTAVLMKSTIQRIGFEKFDLQANLHYQKNHIKFSNQQRSFMMFSQPVV